MHFNTYLLKRTTIYHHAHNSVYFIFFFITLLFAMGFPSTCCLYYTNKNETRCLNKFYCAMCAHIMLSRPHILTIIYESVHLRMYIKPTPALEAVTAHMPSSALYLQLSKQSAYANRLQAPPMHWRRLTLRHSEYLGSLEPPVPTKPRLWPAKRA